jgi:hypothetical protein
MTKAELDYSRSLSTETNSILARLDALRSTTPSIGATLAAPQLRRSKFSPATLLASNSACLSRKPRPMPTSSAPWSPSNLRDVAI